MKMRLSVLAVFFIFSFVPEAWSNPLEEDCDQRYFEHYFVKGCEPVFDQNRSKCPTRFKCPQTTANGSADVCKFKGKEFQPGEDIPTGNPCQICSCRKMWEEEEVPSFMCVGVECPSAFGFGRPLLNDSCYEVYDKDSCCSTRTQCGETERTCAYGGRTYFAGQQIYPDDNPCVVCTCGEGWTGDVSTDPNCRRLNCILAERMDQLKRGCLPIYHEATCCPIEYYCGEMLPDKKTPLATVEDIGSGNTCAFNGSHYSVGQVLDIGHPTHCVTCRCTTPPEFTCVHRSCVYSDEEECLPTYTPDTCCPTYDCPTGTTV